MKFEMTEDTVKKNEMGMFFIKIMFIIIFMGILFGEKEKVIK